MDQSTASRWWTPPAPFAPERVGHRRSATRSAFTLIEALVVVGLIGLLAALLMPTLARARAAATRIHCVGNLYQLGLAGQLYWDDHGGCAFSYRGAATNGGDLYWFGWLERGVEGRRSFDRAQGALHPYLGSEPVAICRSLDYALRDFKGKATGAAFGYGYNLHLSPLPEASPIRVSALARPSGTVFLADAAQVNTFQWPASPDHPMLEEFYYVNATERTAHFRHGRRANAVFVDGHVGAESAVDGSWDERLPRHRVARLRPEIVHTVYP